MHTRVVSSLLFCLSALPLVAQDQLTKQALQRIEEVEKKEPGLATGDVRAANLLLNSLDWAGKRLNAVSNKNEATWKDAQKRFGEVRQKIEAKAKAGAPVSAGGYDAAKLAQLDKEIRAATSNFKMLSVKHLADPFRAQSAQKELDDFGKRLASFPAADEPVKLVAAQLAEFQQLFTAGMAQLQKDVGAGAAVATRLQELDTKYDAAKLPKAIEPPFTEAQVTAWATEIRRWRDTEMPADLAFLDEAAKNSAVDQQHVSRLRGWLGEGFGRRVGEAILEVQMRIESDVTEGQRIADWILETDAKDRDQVSNRILGKGRFDENMVRLRQGEHAVAIAMVHDTAMAIATPPDRTAQLAKAQKATAHLQALTVACLDAARMPEAASTDAELTRIATETLKAPAYAVPAWERLVINRDKVHYQRRESWIRPGTVAATVSTYDYVWDEFQVTTAEKQGDEVWLWANRLKHYTSGDPTTPIGRWILSERFQMTRILPENVAK